MRNSFQLVGLVPFFAQEDADADRVIFAAAGLGEKEARDILVGVIGGGLGVARCGYWRRAAHGLQIRCPVRGLAP
jgi:hypothetical protein